MCETGGDVTRLLAEVRQGDENAPDRLIRLVYRELRGIAGEQMRRERPDHTLQPTVLVHDAFLKLIGQDRIEWQGRSQFFAVAAQMMRRLLVDYARQRGAAKRKAPARITGELFQNDVQINHTDEILIVNQVLDRLNELDPRQAKVVELRYFGGLSVDETATVMGLAPRTVKLDWALARAWMRSQLFEESAPPLEQSN